METVAVLGVGDMDGHLPLIIWDLFGCSCVAHSQRTRFCNARARFSRCMP